MNTVPHTLASAMVSRLQEYDAQYAPQPTSSELGSCWVVQADVELVILMHLSCCELFINTRFI